jgi:DNA-binding protein H-NS
MATYQELLAQKESLEKQILEAKAREKAEGVAKAKAIIEQYNLSASDIFNRKGPAGSRGGKVAKYRNPNTVKPGLAMAAPKMDRRSNRAQFAI